VERGGFIKKHQAVLMNERREGVRMLKPGPVEKEKQKVPFIQRNVEVNRVITNFKTNEREKNFHRQYCI